MRKRVDTGLPKCYTIVTKGKGDTTMRKVEMVNRMIILGCISESDRDLFMSMTIEVVTKIYIKVIPLKLEFLKKN